MNRAKKKLFGFLGLVFVAVMTVIATAIPTPSAGATSSATDIIRVIVHNRYPAVTITEPANNHIFATASPEIDISYDNISKVALKLTFEDEDGISHDVNLTNIVPSDEELDPELGIASGSVASVINDLNNYGGYNKYTLTVTGSGSGAFAEDIITFYYASVAPTYDSADANTGDPIINIAHDAGVGSYSIQVYQNGVAKFETPISYTVPNPGYNGSKNFTLPFASYGLESGNYEVVVTPYDLDGEEMEIDENIKLDFTYTRPVTPDVPNTGFLTNNLTISEADYVITGLMIFFGSAIAALIIINRKKTSRPRRH